MSVSKTAHRPGNSVKQTAGFFLLAFAISLFLHFVPLFIFTPYTVTPQKTNDHHRFTVMVSDPKVLDLEYWLENSHPYIFTKPDAVSGFSSMESQKADPYLELPQPLPENYAVRKNLAALVFPPRPPEKLLSPEPEPQSVKIPAQKTSEPFTAYADGHLIQIKAPGQVRPDEDPVNAVLITVRKSADSALPPSLSIERSCGVRRLDLLALRAASDFVIRLPQEKTATPRSITIDWKPAIKENKK